MSDSSDDDSPSTGASASGGSKSFSLRFQKNIASKLSTKRIAKRLIDDRTSRLLDNLRDLARIYTNDKKFAEKLQSNIIKIVVKIELLLVNKQFSPDDKQNFAILRQKIHTFVINGISYYENVGMLDVDYLHKQILEIKKCIQTLVTNHLSDKSKQRIDMVFDFCAQTNFLKEGYTNRVKYGTTVDSFMSDVKFYVEQKVL